MHKVAVSSPPLRLPYKQNFPFFKKRSRILALIEGGAEEENVWKEHLASFVLALFPGQEAWKEKEEEVKKRGNYINFKKGMESVVVVGYSQVSYIGRWN